MKPRFQIPLVMIFITLLGCERAADFDAQLELLSTPAGTESFASQVFAVDGRVSLSWLEKTDAGHALRYAVWQEGGWSAARDVTRGENWFANWADLPGVRPRDGGGWLAWWLQKSGPGTYAYDVQLAVSDDGEHWRAIGKPHNDGTETEHGFVTAFDLPAGELGLVWLDGRNTSPGAAHEHAHGGGGMTLRYGIFAGDEQQHEGELDSRVCDCCQTASARAGDATVLVYRDRSKDEVRDIYSRRFIDGSWQPPVRVHADGWEIPGCPVNGPAIAAADEFVAVTWFTAPKGQGEVRMALSNDGGRSFAAPLRIDDGRPEGRVDVVVHPQHGLLVSWLEKTDEGGEVRMRPVSRDGSPGDSVTLVGAAASRATGFPRMAALQDGTVVMTWTDASGAGRQLRSARLRFR